MSLLHTIIRQMNEAASKKRTYPDWMKKRPDWIAAVERGDRNQASAKTKARSALMRRMAPRLPCVMFNRSWIS